MRRAKGLMVILAVICVSASISIGAVIYDSFDYAVGSIVGQDGGQGWGGAWNMPTTSGTEEVVADSLVFSDYATSGGALKLVKQADPGTFVSVGVRRQLGVDFTVGDDVWVSFLAKSADPLTVFTSRTAELRHGPTVGAVEFRMRPKGSSSQGVFIAYDSSASNSAAKSAQDGSTYLYVCRFGDVGTDAGKYAVMWVFDEAGYDAIKADGVFTESELADNYYLMAQDVHANKMLDSTDSAYFNLADSQAASFGYYFDELRYATSLDDVLTVPEPMTALLLGFGGLVFIRKK